MKILTVHFDEDEEYGLDYLEEAIDQAGGHVVTVVDSSDL